MPVVVDKKAKLKECVEHAASRGGKCLSEEYVNNRVKMEWQCKNNHTWQLCFYRTRTKNGWCPDCKREIRQNEELVIAKNHAIKLGGQCLSDEYIDNRVKMTWRCSHYPHHPQWESSSDHIIRRGQWCRECAIQESILSNGLELSMKYAISRGGECLSNEYVGSHSPMKWKCSSKLHPIFESSYSNTVTAKHWCAKCSHEDNGQFKKLNNGLELAKQYAQSKGGKCLSNEYISVNNKMSWQCAKMHCWDSLYFHVIKGGWCPVCNIERQVNSDGLKLAQEYAQSRNGNCLSIKYIKSNHLMAWKCNKKNHPIWLSPYNCVVRGKSWCRFCSGNTLDAEEVLKNAKLHAQKLGGDCLSDKYVNTKTKMLWKCSNLNHPCWSTKLSHVINGSWCPECSIYHQKERQSRKLLEYLLGFELKKDRPKWNINPKTGYLLELDGYNEKNKIAFEYQGIHHYEEEVWGEGASSLEYVQFKDNIKAQHCKDKGIALIIIDGRKKIKTSRVMIKMLINLLELYKIPYKKNIDFKKVEDIYQISKIPEENRQKANAICKTRDKKIRKKKADK